MIQLELEAKRADAPAALDLKLTVRDREMIADLCAVPEGRARHDHALAALRLGLLALRHARGEVDAGAIRRESERMLAELQKGLQSHETKLHESLQRTLADYFDPKSGRFAERVERLVAKDGELERVMRAQIGQQDSELARTLAAHLGEQSPVVRLLDPQAGEGVLAALAKTLDEELARQRERILGEFSLDKEDGALRRLVKELTERHGQLADKLQGSVKEVVEEFSLDKEDSALSRLVRRVDDAQRQISREFSLDDGSSALARMRKELLEVFEQQRKDHDAFQAQVKEALAAMKAQREEAARSTRHGHDFEREVFAFVQRRAQDAGDVAQATGNTTGLIRHCKKGDFTVELGAECAAAGAKIAGEAKEDASYALHDARLELDEAKKNRGADVGLFVFSKKTAPEGLAPFSRHGGDVFIVWDAEDPASDVFLDAGLSLARALCTRAALRTEARAADLEQIERAIREIDKRAGTLGEVLTWGANIERDAGKILERVRQVVNKLAEQVAVLDEASRDLHTALGGGGSV